MKIRKRTTGTAGGAARWVAAAWLTAAVGGVAAAAPLPIVTGVDLQPLVAATRRLTAALEFAGAPLPAEDLRQLDHVLAGTDPAAVAREVQRILDPHCLAMVTISPESRVSVAAGPADRRLVEQGWSTFLVKVANEAGINPPLRFESPNVAPIYRRSRGEPRPSAPPIAADELVQRFLDAAMMDRQPMMPTLSGLPLEYRILQLFSRDAGRREAALGFSVGQGTQDIGFRNQVPVLFDCRPARPVTIGMRDVDGTPTIGWLLVRDAAGRVFPNPARRLAPDFFFHQQIYRADGEQLLLPPGDYTVEAGRGPEYEVQRLSLTVPEEGGDPRIDVPLRRWIHLAERHWYSGDHHVHAAGCSHYETPSEGVTPADMIRHIVGEDLNVGCVLSWGPCWYAQKQFFEGGTHPLSRPRHLMRYDVEVSGFPSSHAGHLCLLRLREDDFEGVETIEEWPSWTLPVNRWAKRQGGVVGYSHSGWGLQTPDIGPGGQRVAPGTGRAPDTLPDHAMPRFDGIGANEFIVTAPLDACDFISAVDTPAVWELNIWYHVLNCGLRTRISGETDFPCIYGERVGLGRAYVKMPADRPLDFDGWVDGLRDGRSYCSEGLSHIIDFSVDGVGVGEPGPDGRLSQVTLPAPGSVTVRFDAAALLEPVVTERTEAIRSARLDAKPYWHIERARIGAGRTVPVEIIVNGHPVARRELVADGRVEPLEFAIDITQSSWVAARVFPAVHTNPVWVEVAGGPVRPSRRSARWCLDAVETCWTSKEPAITAAERPAARQAYDEARAFYAAVLEQAFDDGEPAAGRP
jgi:hypothetical protein